MKIIKDNSQKEYKAKCTRCKSKFSFKSTELTEHLGDLFSIDCPACKKKNRIRENILGYYTY